MKKSVLQKSVLAFLVILGGAFTFCAAYPGFMSPDSLDQYQQALSGKYTDWHPPVMAWIWHQLLYLHNGPQPMLLLNTLLFWGAVAMIAFRIRNFALSLIFTLCSFAPCLLNFLGVIWKDSLLLSLLFLLTALLYHLSDKPLKPFYRTLTVLFITSLCLLAILIRYNAAAAVVPLLGALIYYQYPSKSLSRPLLYAFGLTAVLWLAAGKINTTLCNGKSLHPEQQLMVYDLMGVASATHTNVFPGYLKNKLTLDTLPKVYSPCDGALFAIFHMGCTASSEAQFEALSHCWRNEVLHHPIDVIRHKKRSFMCLIRESSLKTFPFIHPNPYGFQVNTGNPAYRLFIRYTENHFAYKLYNAWVYLAICVAVCCVSLVRLLYQKITSAALPTCISLSGLLYCLAYFFLSPCNDLRYNYWTYGAGFLGAVLLINSFVRQK
ncbi:MAG: hypothetical protein QM743_13080 [Chitinophagaceae bacterium]